MAKGKPKATGEFALTPTQKESVRRGRPLTFESPDDLAEGIMVYFQECEERDTNPTYTGLCASLGVDKATLWRYGRRDDFCKPVQKALAVIESAYEGLLMQNRNNAGVIFALKNNFNWKDRQEIDLTAEVNTLTDEQLSERLMRFLEDSPELVKAAYHRLFGDHDGPGEVKALPAAGNVEALS